MDRSKGFHLSLNMVISIVIGLILVAAVWAIASGFMQKGEQQIIDLAGL